MERVYVTAFGTTLNKKESETYLYFLELCQKVDWPGLECVEELTNDINNSNDNNNINNNVNSNDNKERDKKAQPQQPQQIIDCTARSFSDKIKNYLNNVCCYLIEQLRQNLQRYYS